MESLVSGFAIYLRVSLTEEEGEVFMGALGVNRMEEQPVIVLPDMPLLAHPLPASNPQPRPLTSLA